MNKIDRGRKAARSFGLTFAILSVLLGGWRGWRGETAIATALAIVAMGLVVVAVARPLLLEAPNRVWMRLARVLGWVNSRVLLTVFFVLVVTPYGLLQRLFGRDPLGRRWRAAPPRWLPAPERLRQPDHYDHLY